MKLTKTERIYMATYEECVRKGEPLDRVVCEENDVITMQTLESLRKMCESARRDLIAMGNREMPEYAKTMRVYKSMIETIDRNKNALTESKESGKNLKAWRTACKISQSKLADLSGVNVRMIQYYEQGVKDINKAEALTVYRLAKALNCHMEDLIEI